MQSYTITVLFITIHLSGCVNIHQSCMTWEKEHSYLRFICRVTDEYMPVILFDSQGNKYEDHTLNDQLYNRKTQESLFHLTNIHEIVFTIDISQKTNVDGIWMCCQGDETFQTEVSVAAGIISATSIRIVGTLIHNFQNSKVKLECFSCREPYGNNVEFLINQQSEDMITFDKDTETCMHITGNCHPSECACSSSGNEFIRIFPVNDVQSTLYSCSMQFTDIDKGSVFIKLASIYFNGTEFLNMTTTTTIIKAADENEEISKSGKYPASFPDIYDTVDKDDEKLLLEVITNAIMICVLPIIAILAVYCFLAFHKYGKKYVDAETMTYDLVEKKLIEAETMTHELDEKTLVEAETMTHELDEKRFVDAETMTLELDKKTLVEAETMTLGLGVNKTSVEAETMTHELDEKKCVDAETMTHEQDTFPVIQAQTAIQGPKTFNIELHFPGIIVFEIMKMEKEMVLTGINLHMKNHYKLFVINIETHKHESFDLENKPNNMTSIDDNIVALPYPDIQKVDMLNLKTGRIEHTIKVNCLAIFHSNDHLYVIKYGKVERINIAGVSIESFNLPTKMIKHISVFDKRLFYTCYESLYCCDLNGTQLWRFIPKIEKRLSDVATDKYGNIYVSSADPVNVLVISQEGKYLKHISMNFENETRPVKIHCDELHNRLSILRPSNNVIAFFDV